MEIRKGTKNDKKELQTLQKELGSFRKNIFSAENKSFHKKIKTETFITDKEINKNIILVATNDKNKIVGLIIGSINERKNHKLNKLGYIEELFVKEKYRKQGLAQRLWEEMEKELKNKKCNHITTHTDFENTLSQNFYTKMGMQKTTVEFWKKI
jgi:ribosomal protein S18 acetylase RimI-like enzyme